jgi:hypothetical protein
MTAIPDFAKERGLTHQTLQLFNVRINGTGWLWDTKRLSGGTATRWKSFYSIREKAPETEQETWKKYTWYPSRPEDAQYFYPPSLSLKTSVDACDGELWLVGGEVASMSMMDAGYHNVTSFFGDSNIPDTLVTDLRNMGVTHLRMIPDRDESGQQCAMNVRDALKDSGIKFTAYQLPYPLETKHGRDVNDYWLSLSVDIPTFLDRIDTLLEWTLPAPQPKPTYNYDTSGYADTDLPASFIADVERALDVYPVFNTDGWSRRNVPCPFHDDVHASATWNHSKAILRCHASCGKSYLAKDVAGFYGIDLRQYFNPVPMYSSESTAPKLDPLPDVMLDIQPIQIVEKQAFRPPLPDSVELTPAQRLEAKQGRKWLDTYVNWSCEAASATPEIFHEAMGLWLLATAATRRIKVQVGGEDIFPNLYILIVAKTSLYRKSTGMKKAAAVLAKANLDVLRLPGEATPEALFDELAGIRPMNFDKLPIEVQRRWMLGRAFAGQKAIMKDEASSILANLKKEYMAGLSEILLQGYDSDAGVIDKRLQSKGLISIKDLSLCFLGATTPVMYAKYIGIEESENGFLARFALITPEGPPMDREAPDHVDMPAALVQDIRHMFLDILPGDYKAVSSGLDEVVSPPVTTATIALEAFTQLKKYRKTLGFDMSAKEIVDDSKSAPYSRLGTMAYKIALLFAAIESKDQAIRIEGRHAYAAQIVCERWRESLHRLDIDVARSQNNGVHEKVLKYIQSSGDVGVTLRDIMKDCGLKTKAYAMDILSTISDEGAVSRFERKPEGKGRPTVIYKYVN